MTLFEDPLADMWQDDTDDLLLEEKGFPCHDSRKQAFFKLVTEQMNAARKQNDFYNLPVASRYRSGLNAVTTFDQTLLTTQAEKENEGGGGGDKEIDGGGASSGSGKKVEVVEEPVAAVADADEKKDDDEAAAPAPEIPPPEESNEETPPPPLLLENDDEYKFALVMVLDYLLKDLGISPINLSLDEIMGRDKSTKKNRRMPWTISNKKEGPVKESAARSSSLEDESTTPLSGDAVRDPQSPSPWSVAAFFLFIFLCTGMTDYYSAYLRTVAWPWNLWNRLLNLSLLHDKVRNAWGSITDG